MDFTPAELETARRVMSGPPVKGNPPGRWAVQQALGCGENKARRLVAHLRKGAEPPQSERLDQFQEHRLRTENRELRRQLQEALGRDVLDQRYQTFISEVGDYKRPIPTWMTEPRSGKPRQAMPVAHLSDAHFDEVVDPAQVGYVNAYNRQIAERRLRRFFEKTISLCDDYLKGVDYAGIILPVSGDMFSGSIHEELKETNAAGLCESLRYWIDPMEAGIKMLADRFGRVNVPWVVGNHPRLDKKPRSKGGVRENFDWLLGALLQRDFGRAKDDRVTFHVSDSFDCPFRVYGTRYLQTHGDQFRGGHGISAELSPLFLGDARKREKMQAVDEPYDVMIMGHWHRRILLPGIKANGSLKGFDEYALKGNLKFQMPMQSFWLDTPEHGITFEAPIFVKADNEGWERGANAPVFQVAA